MDKIESVIIPYNIKTIFNGDSRHFLFLPRMFLLDPAQLSE